jgi:hypothetical protein
VAWETSGGIAGITAALTVHADHTGRATLETGGDPPRRLERLLRHLARLHERHAPAR